MRKAAMRKSNDNGFSAEKLEDLHLVNLPRRHLGDVTGVQDAAGGEGVGGEGGTLALPWVGDWKTSKLCKTCLNCVRCHR